MRRLALLLAFAAVLAGPAHAAINVDTTRRTALVTDSKTVGSLQAQAAGRVSSPWGSTGQTANLWISSTGVTSGCTRSATPVAYNPATDCSFDQANDRCNGGDTAYIKGGSYGNQALTGTNSRTSRCTMTVAAGETAQLAYLNLGEYNSQPGSPGWAKQGPDWLTIQGNETGTAGCRDLPVGTCSLRMTVYDATHTNQITLANFEANANGAVDQCFHTEDADNLIIKRAVLHNCRSNNNTGGMIYTSGDTQTFEDLYAYDGLLLVGYSGTPHTECMYATGTSGLTLRRVHFYSCSAEIVLVTGSTTAPNLTVENSIFQRPNGPNDNSFKFRDGSPTTSSPAPVNVLMRNNLFASITGIDAANRALSSGSFYNNFVKGSNVMCSAGSIVCSNNDTSEADSSFTSPVWTSNGDTIATPRGDFTLTAAAAAVTSGGLVNTGSTLLSCPTVDFLGRARPFGAACDIGPYEYGAS